MRVRREWGGGDWDCFVGATLARGEVLHQVWVMRTDGGGSARPETQSSILLVGLPHCRASQVSARWPPPCVGFSAFYILSIPGPPALSGFPLRQNPFGETGGFMAELKHQVLAFFAGKSGRVTLLPGVACSSSALRCPFRDDHSFQVSVSAPWPTLRTLASRTETRARESNRGQRLQPRIPPCEPPVMPAVQEGPPPLTLGPRAVCCRKSKNWPMCRRL